MKDNSYIKYLLLFAGIQRYCISPSYAGEFVFDRIKSNTASYRAFGVAAKMYTGVATTQWFELTCNSEPFLRSTGINLTGRMKDDMLWIRFQPQPSFFIISVFIIVFSIAGAFVSYIGLPWYAFVGGMLLYIVNLIPIFFTTKSHLRKFERLIGGGRVVWY